VILATGVGYAVRQFTGWEPALMVGLFVGLLTAPLVPKKQGCGLHRHAD